MYRNMLPLFLPLSIVSQIYTVSFVFGTLSQNFDEDEVQVGLDLHSITRSVNWRDLVIEK